MNMRNTAFFSTCNNSYIPQSVTSLLSVREHIPGARLYILSRNISGENRRLLDYLNINYFDLDLRGRFYREWQYPAECYYIFAGPELLLTHGFRYSIYLDGDVLCLNNPLSVVGRTEGIAGTTFGDGHGIFGGDAPIIKEKFHLTDSVLSAPRITSSVVCFNNKKMKKIHLLDLATKTFKDCLDSGIPRKGDDSLFSLIQYLAFSPKERKDLGQSFNYLTPLFGVNPPKDTVFLHYNEYKPWLNSPDLPSSLAPYTSSWQQLYTANFFPTWRLPSIPQPQASLLLPSLDVKQKNSTKKPLKVFQSNDPSIGLLNFGDEFSSPLITQLFGFHTEATRNPNEADLFAIGSILSFLNSASTIKKKVYCWGSGFIDDAPLSIENDQVKNFHFSAVRGRKTLNRIKEFQPHISVPLGDPGILVNLIYPPSNQKSNQIGIVHHFIDCDTPLVSRLRSDPRFLIINPLDPPAEVARQISSCPFVLSSSLHGLIFADSYHIPNAHITFSDQVMGGEYKFTDYDSAFNRKHLDADPDKITDFNYLAQLATEYQPIKNLKKHQQALIDSFPF